MDDPRKLRDVLADQSEARGINQSELIKKTGAPSEHIEALLSGETRRLPAFPYIRTTLVRVAEVLGLAPEVVIQKYKAEFSQMHSGPSDRLPANRFALPSHRRAYIIGAGVAGLVIIAYLISRTGFFGQPSLTLVVPPSEPSPFISTTSTIILSGRTDPGDTLSINGQHVAVASDGTFNKEYQLSPEINIIEFSVKRFLGRQASLTRQVYYDISSTSTVPVVIPKTIPVITSESSSTEGTSTQ